MFDVICRATKATTAPPWPTRSWASPRMTRTSTEQFHSATRTKLQWRRPPNFYMNKRYNQCYLKKRDKVFFVPRQEFLSDLCWHHIGGRKRNTLKHTRSHFFFTWPLYDFSVLWSTRPILVEPRGVFVELWVWDAEGRPLVVIVVEGGGCKGVDVFSFTFELQ